MRILGFVAALCLMAATSAAAAPLEAYGRLPSIEDITISPDGTRLALITTNGEDRQIVLQNRADGKLQVLGVGDTKVRDLKWADNDNLLITKSTTTAIAGLMGPRREWFQTFHYNAPSGKGRMLLQDASNSLNTVAGPPVVRQVDGKAKVFVEGVRFVGGRGRIALFEVKLKNTSSDLVHEGFEYTRDWLVDAQGEPLAESEYDIRDGEWRLRLKSGTGWRVVETIKAGNEQPVLAGLGRDGRSILIAQRQGERLILREISPVDGGAIEQLEAPDNGRPIFDPKTHALIGFSGLVGEEQRFTFLQPDAAKVWAAIQAAYKGERVSLVAWSDDRSKVVVKVDSPTDGPAYAFVDLTTRKATWIGGVYDGVKAEDIAPVRHLRFKAADGTELTGYLTLPKGREAKGLPLIVNPHGGPAARDEPGFDWWSQAMASRGYAVLRVNYRGSAGFGWKFLEAGFGQWGRKMQTDLSDGVRYLAAEGAIDPKRVCIVGASYGGYAALAGATLDPGVYRCAASVSGPSDLRRFVIWSRSANGLMALRYWTRFMGAENQRDEVLDQISPALHVDKAQVPILLIHGKDDTVVPLEQTLIMQRALEKAGKPVEMVIMPGEDHWLSRGETRMQMLRSVMAFVEKNNPPT